MVPADSDGASPTPPYSGYTPPKHLTSTGLSPCAARLPRRFEFNVFGLCMSYNPRRTVIRLVWALPRSLATTWGITIVFSSSCYLDVSVHRVRLPLARDSSPSDWRVAPFGHPRIVSLCADPRGFSQLAASFFASESQGIPRMLLLSSSFSRSFGAGTLIRTLFQSIMSKNFSRAFCPGSRYHKGTIVVCGE